MNLTGGAAQRLLAKDANDSIVITIVSSGHGKNSSSGGGHGSNSSVGSGGAGGGGGGVSGSGHLASRILRTRFKAAYRLTQV